MLCNSNNLYVEANFLYNRLNIMVSSQKKLENLLRRHSVIAEDGFFLISFIYIKKHIFNIKESNLEEIFKKGDKIFKKISADKNLVAFLDEIVLLDPYGEHLPVWYQFFLSRRFRGNSGKFFTPRSIAKAMADLLPIKKDAIVMDPTCGGGTFLLEVSKRWGNTPVHLVGNDLDESLIDLSTLVLSIGTQKNHKKSFLNTDIYESQKFGIWKGKVDYILANPPFSLPIKQVESGSNLFNLGYKTSDAVFLDICKDLLKDDGTLVCLLPHSIIANAEYQRLREVVENDWNLLGVIGMPEGIFHLTAGTTARADIVMLKKKGKKSLSESKTFFGFAPSIGIPFNNRLATSTKNELQDLVNNLSDIKSKK